MVGFWRHYGFDMAPHEARDDERVSLLWHATRCQVAALSIARPALCCGMETGLDGPECSRGTGEGCGDGGCSVARCQVVALSIARPVLRCGMGPGLDGAD